MHSSGTPNTPGIYKITCIPTGKIYIGSTINLRWRRKTHFGHLQHNKHRNPKLQAAWNKYGPDAFAFDIVELVLVPDLLTAREQYYLDTLKPFDKRGFNIGRVAESSLGQKRSLETRKNISDAQRGKPRLNQRGRKQSPESIELRIRHIRGKKQSEEHRRKTAATRIGKKHSEATREKIRLSALGHAPTNVKTFILTDPEGVEYVVYGLPKFCKEHHLSSSTMVQVAKGKRKQYKGWKARYQDIQL